MNRRSFLGAAGAAGAAAGAGVGAFLLPKDHFDSEDFTDSGDYKVSCEYLVEHQAYLILAAAEVGGGEYLMATVHVVNLDDVFGKPKSMRRIEDYLTGCFPWACRRRVDLRPLAEHYGY